MSHIRVVTTAVLEYFRTGVTTSSIRRAVLGTVLAAVAVGLGGTAHAAPIPPPRLRVPPTEGYTDASDRPAELGLQRVAEGGYAYIDPSHRFTMTILPDGRVRFADRWRRPSEADPQHGRCCARPPEGVMAALNPFAGIAMAGPLEWMIRSRGHDLATADKVELLSRTEELRTKLAIAWAREHLARSLRALPGQLEALWQDTEIPPAQRRTILFEHWDACEDRLGVDTEGIPTDAVIVVDRERLATANRARQAIVDFIRQKLGPGTPHAYPRAELERLNARRTSVARFSPYGASP